MKRPIFTLPSIVKKVFRPGERSLPREEICARMEAGGLTSGTELDGASLLDRVLKMEPSPVRVGSSEAIVEITYQPHQLFDLAFRYLRETQSPKLLNQIASELRRQTQFGLNQIMRLLQLEKDPRFVQVQGDARWLLAEWTIANDQVYDFCRKNGITKVTMRSLSYFLEQEVQVGTEAVFLPGLDDRFRIDGDSLYITMESKDTEEQLTIQEIAAAIAQEEEAKTSMQVNHPDEIKPEQDGLREEVTMNSVQSQQTIQEVRQLLEQAISRLEARNREMAQEVVVHFQQNNMQAIEVLMIEKNKHEQIATGIQQLLAASEQ